jgi:hypothetical protein
VQMACTPLKALMFILLTIVCSRIRPHRASLFASYLLAATLQRRALASAIRRPAPLAPGTGAHRPGANICSIYASAPALSVSLLRACLGVTANGASRGAGALSSLIHMRFTHIHIVIRLQNYFLFSHVAWRSA